MNEEARTATTRHFSIPFDSLNITGTEVARSIGYTEATLSAPFAEDLDALVREAGNHASIEGGFQVFPPESVSLDRDAFHVEGLDFDTGRIIAGPLRGAASLVFFVVTAGPGFTAWSSALMRNKEHVLAYFVDALGSETVERATDWVEGKIEAWAGEQGWPISNRYSPGYCDWHVSEQHKLFSLLPDGFCGVTLTDTALMQPTKSVSGVIGIGGKAKKRAYACSICSMEDCFRRNMLPH